ncbi:MAG: elongation factor P, partial [Burkholderiales bacterium]|nr:elongation factor P [Burkholderiales bacterium]
IILRTMMSKILATEIRVGYLLEWDKHLWKVHKCYHVHVGGRGGAYMQVEMKDVERGTKVNQRFVSDEKVERANVESRNMDYLYNDGESYVFMDTANFEQMNISADFLEGQSGYILPNSEVQIYFHNDRPIGLELPQTVILEVTECDPSIKGSTVTTSFKPATLETGISVLVPPFVEKGEKIKVNTDTGEYMERA